MLHCRVSLPGTNTLAYYKNTSIIVVESFIGLTPVVERMVRQGRSDFDESGVMMKILNPEPDIVRCYGHAPIPSPELSSQADRES